MQSTGHDPNSNPSRLLLRVPVPWVFILAYLLGVAAEYVWPLHVTVAMFQASA